MPVSFTFNGVKKDYLRVLVGLERPAWAPIEEEILEIPGRPGGIITKQHTTVRRLNIPVRVYKKGFNSLEELEEDLAAWLVTDEPKPLEFDHKPNRVYYAKVTGELIFTEYPQWADGVISFICLDPYKYGPELVKTFQSDVVTLTNEGTAEAEPIFELEVKEPVTMAMIQNQENEYMMIGRPVDEEAQQPTQEEEVIFNNPMESTVGWTKPAKLENAALQGEMRASGGSFYGYSFGEPISKRYYGPALKTSLGEEIRDFKVEAIVTFDNSRNANMAGKVEIALLDDRDNVVAVMALKDSYSQQKMTEGIIRVGGISGAKRYLLNTPGAVPGQWNGFKSGMLRIEKRGNVWRAYIAKITQEGVHHSRYPAKWVDTENVFTDRKISQIQVSTLRWGITDIPDMWIHHLKVWKINDLSENQIPYIAAPGDIITFDHKNADILINGESRMDLKQFGASFFKLKPGENQLVVTPDDSFDVKCRYRPTYL